jgi:SAM-dependent methyltransferase
MYPDVTQINQFYGTSLGHFCQEVMADRLLTEWPELDGLRVGGFGYTLPLLSGLLPICEIEACVMPAPMGVTAWPHDGPNKATLAAETDLPLPDESLDRLAVCHALEHVESPKKFLRELWRVTSEEGRVMLFVPNRRSFWALSDKTPFGHGRPFSRGQLAALLRDSLFEVTRLSGVFYSWPGTSTASVGVSRFVDRWGRNIWRNMPGVWMVEARKRVTAPLTDTKPVRKRAYAPVGLSSTHSSSSSSS